MADTEFFLDMPCEPQVHAPKTSSIQQASNAPASNTDPYRNMSVLKKLSTSKFSIYLVKPERHTKTYAMKVFPQANDNTLAKLCYQNELRFAAFSHPNVIKIVHSEIKTDFASDDLGKIAYTLMEHAPNGHLANFLTKHKSHFNDKLIRTYFRQLIDGLEYIHNKGAVHLDIKPDNLLLDENFSLKIADFDLSASIGDLNPPGKGTKFFRTPELLLSDYKASSAADIYSAGIVLFLLKSGGVLPHSEELYCKGINLFDLLNQNNKEFWRVHCRIQNKNASFFDEDFKDLFTSMLKVKPDGRATIQEVKSSKWFNGEVYTKEELREFVQAFSV